MNHALLVLLAVSAALGQPTAGIRGSVRDAQTGEALAGVRVQLISTDYQTVTDRAGGFQIEGLPPAAYTLQAATVGYRVVKKEFTIAAGEIQEFDAVLSPDTFRRTETVEVRAGPFDALRGAPAPSEITLSGSEMKNLASVLADDPLRAVQTLPGVTADDDFNARFSVRGASFERVGLYLDDVLLHAPFHSIQSQGSGGTLTIFNGDMVEDMALYPGAPPSRFPDRTAGALDVRMRDGSRSQFSARGTASASNAGLMAEGPLGAARRGSWIASVRKSYLQYIVKRTSTDPTLAGGFWDAQGRLSYDPAPRHTLTLSFFDGYSGLDRTDARARLGANSDMTDGFHFTLVNLGWRYTASERFFVTTRAAWSRERAHSENRDNLSLLAGRYGEWTSNTNAAWAWSSRHALEFGANLRRLRDDGYSNQYQFNPFAVRRLDEYRGHTLRAGGYAQQSFALAAGRIRIVAGARWDRDSASDRAAASPQASVTFLPRPSTRIQLGWGQYVQFPELRTLFSRIGAPRLLPERAIHYVAAFEQRIGDRSRVRIETYQRQDRDLLFRPFADPRLAAGRVWDPPLDSPYRNSLRGYARGAEIWFQRRTANRFTGWVSYALSYARVRDGAARASFPADDDQRHTVNVYGSYRVRPSVNLSSRWVYGSGYPVPGFFRLVGPLYYLAEARNTVRLAPYHRTDLRVNKALVFGRWKLTLYGEVVNLFNRANTRFDVFNGYNSRTGQAYPAFNKMFPILPSAGVVVEM